MDDKIKVSTSSAFQYFVDYIYPEKEKSNSLKKAVYDFKNGDMSEKRMRMILNDHGFTVKKETIWEIPK